MIKNIPLFSNYPCADILWDNDTVVTGGRNFTITFWYLKSNTSFVPTALSSYDALQLKFSPKEKLLAIATSRHCVVLHNLTSLKNSILINNDTGISGMCFSNDGSLLAVGTYSKLLIWDVNAKMCVAKYGKQGLDSCSFSADDKYLAACYQRSLIKIWKIERLSKRVKLREKSKIVLEPGTYTHGVRFSPTDNKLLATSWSLWNIETGKEVVKFQHGARAANDIAFYGDTVAVCCVDKKISLCNSKSGNCFESWIAHNDFIRQLKFSQNFQLLVSCSLDQSVTIWNIFNRQYFVKVAFLLLRKKISNYVVLDIINFVLSDVKTNKFQNECKHSTLQKTSIIHSLRSLF